MNITIKRLLNQIGDGKYINGSYCKDLHIIRFYSSYVVISNGRVIKVTNPCMTYCPLAGFLYKNINLSGNPSLIKEVIKRAIESKISEFGYFTEKRELFSKDIAIPYGASEILMYALKKKSIDAAVVVCDGAGTVIVNKPEIVQGVGARMNGIFYTSPIQGIIRKLEKTGSHVISQDGTIDQIKGIGKAASLGYKNIAVTINASMDVPVSMLRKIENDFKISLTSLAVCTTGLNRNRIQEIGKYTDIVWSCASKELRMVIGKKAIIQLSKKIPVFVLTKKGLDLVSNYSSHKALIKNLDLSKQYIIAGGCKGKKIKMGNFDACLSEAELPVRHNKEPILNAVYS
jgi:putative methanogenesis marker protein 8